MKKITVNGVKLTLLTPREKAEKMLLLKRVSPLNSMNLTFLKVGTKYLVLHGLCLADLAKLTPVYIPLRGWAEVKDRTPQFKEYQAALTKELKRRGHI